MASGVGVRTLEGSLVLVFDLGVRTGMEGKGGKECVHVCFWMWWNGGEREVLLETESLNGRASRGVRGRARCACLIAMRRDLLKLVTPVGSRM